MKVLFLLFCIISLLLSCGESSGSVLPPEATAANSIVPSDTQEAVVTPSASVTPASETSPTEEDPASDRTLSDSLAHDYLLHLLDSIYSLSDLKFSDPSLDPADTMGPNTLVEDDMYYTYSESGNTSTLRLFGSITYNGTDYDFGISTSNPLILSTTEFGITSSVVTGQISEVSPTSNYVHTLDFEITYLGTDSDFELSPIFEGSISSTVTPQAEDQICSRLPYRL